MAEDKLYVSYETVHKMVKGLAGKLEEIHYTPDAIVAIGSGGFIPARILKTFIQKPIYAVGISFYGTDHKHGKAPRKIQWIDEVQQEITGKNIVLIDEVNDSQATLAYCIGELLKYKPNEIVVMVLHDKKKQKDVDMPKEIKHYYPAMLTEDIWIGYPWDAIDIDWHTEMEKKN